MTIKITQQEHFHRIITAHSDTHIPLIKSRHERAPFIFYLQFCASSMAYNGGVICHIEHRHRTNIERNR